MVGEAGARWQWLWCAPCASAELARSGVDGAAENSRRENARKADLSLAVLLSLLLLSKERCCRAARLTTSRSSAYQVTMRRRPAAGSDVRTCVRSWVAASRLQLDLDVANWKRMNASEKVHHARPDGVVTVFVQDEAAPKDGGAGWSG